MNDFAEIDDLINQFIPNRAGLNPQTFIPNSFVNIRAKLEAFQFSSSDLDVLYDAYVQIVKSATKNFPNNIFWDFDLMSHSIASYFAKDKNPESLFKYVDQYHSIFCIFGADSPVKFQYIHDFIYGYDWLKWMLEKRKPEEDKDPFGEDFLRYIYNRGLELVCLIQKNDQKYPELTEEYRNPFLFGRSPKEEILLHRTLSSDSLLPLDSWDVHAVPRADKDYSLIRLERSKALGIEKNQQAGSHKI